LNTVEVNLAFALDHHNESFLTSKAERQQGEKTMIPVGQRTDG